MFDRLHVLVRKRGQKRCVEKILIGKVDMYARIMITGMWRYGGCGCNNHHGEKVE